jgi:hypothetical protein
VLARGGETLAPGAIGAGQMKEIKAPGAILNCCTFVFCAIAHGTRLAGQ